MPRFTIRYVAVHCLCICVAHIFVVFSPQPPPPFKLSQHFPTHTLNSPHKQEGESYELIPNSSFVVARTVDRDSKSDYWVNDRRQTMAEVTTLLKGKGIDLDNNRFLILQGEVEQISMMKPKGSKEDDTGLLEYLEDIIGTQQYVPKLEELGKRLEEVGEKRASMVERVKAAERERDRLEGAKTEAEAYLGMERDLARLNVLHAKLNLADVAHNLATATRSQAELEGRLLHERQKNQSMKAELATLEKEMDAESAALKVLQDSLQEKNEAMHKFELQDTKFRADKQELKERKERTKRKLEEDTGKVGDLDATLTKLQKTYPEAQQKVEKLEAEHSAAERKAEELEAGAKGEKEALRKEMGEIRKRMQPGEARRTKAEGALTLLKTERESLMKGRDDATKKLKQIELEQARVETSVK